jgi:hypothetical protein
MFISIVLIYFYQKQLGVVIICRELGASSVVGSLSCDPGQGSTPMECEYYLQDAD